MNIEEEFAEVARYDVHQTRPVTGDGSLLNVDSSLIKVEDMTKKSLSLDRT